MTEVDIFDCASYLYDGGWRASDKDLFMIDHPEHSDEEVDKIMKNLFAFELEEKLHNEYDLDDDDIFYLCKLLDSSNLIDILTHDMPYSSVEAESICKILRDFMEAFYG